MKALNADEIKDIVEETIQTWYEDNVEYGIKNIVERAVSEEFDGRMKELKTYDRERFKIEREVCKKVDELVDKRLPQLVTSAVTSKVKEVENDLLVELVRRSLNFQGEEYNESEM